MVMQVLRHYENVPEELRNSVIAIGSFDGMNSAPPRAC
jgi:FAD synthase